MASVGPDSAVVVVPKIPELAVVLLGCWEVVALAAGTAVRVVALCEELFCPDVWVDVVVLSASVAPDVMGVVPLTVIGDVAAGDGDVPALVVLVVVL